MYIPNDDIQNYNFCRFQLLVEMFGHLTKSSNQSKFNQVPKVVKPTNKKTFGNYCNKQPNVPTLPA